MIRGGEGREELINFLSLKGVGAYLRGRGLNRGFTISALQWWLLLPSCAVQGEQASVADSFPVAPEVVLIRTHCIKGRPHEILSPFPACPATLTSFLLSLSSPLKNK